MTPRLNKATWVMTAIYTALLTTASLLPSGQGLLGGWDASISPDLQDALHLPAYAGIVVLWTLSWSTRSPLSTRSILAVTCACVAFGAAMELAQSVIPGRTCGLGDGLVNTTGTILGLALAFGWRLLWQRRLGLLPADQSSAGPSRYKVS
jgi:VanZ family protein